MGNRTGGKGRVNTWTSVCAVLVAAAVKLDATEKQAEIELVKHARTDLFEVCCPHDSGLSQAVAASGGKAQRISF